MTYAQWLEAYCSGRPWKCTNSETQRCVDSVQTFTRNANLNMHCGLVLQWSPGSWNQVVLHRKSSKHLAPLRSKKDRKHLQSINQVVSDL